MLSNLRIEECRCGHLMLTSKASIAHGNFNASNDLESVVDRLACNEHKERIELLVSQLEHQIG